jgi:PAS domain S-box-containing protein
VPLTVYQQMVDASPHAMIVVDPKGCITLANAQTETLFEHPRDELVGQLVEILIPARLRPAFRAMLDPLLARPAASLHGADGSVLGVTRSGVEMPVEIRFSPIETRRGLCVLASITDISERRRQEALLEIHRLMVEAAPYAMILVDPAGRIDLVNASAERQFGYQRRELIGKGVEILVPNELRAGHQRLREAFQARPAERPMGVSQDLVACTKDGRRVPVEIGLSPIKTHLGEMVVAAILDVTERRRAEADLRNARAEAEAATRAKAVFLATMSHEIRTPMNAIIGMTSILLESGLTADQLEWTNTIRSSGEHLLTVINDILDFSKIEAGKIELDLQPCSVRDCVESAIDLVLVSANQREVEIGYLIDPDVPIGILGDVAHLRQVLVNLLSNAVKFTPAGGYVSVEVESRPLGSLHELWFAVRDSGIGLSPDQQGKLFRPFSQVDPSTTRVYGGTGLGLSICKRLCELMGGRIWVESRAGEGATFRFTSVAAGTLDVSGGMLVEVPILRGRRALIVDDIEVNRRILEHYTRAWGMDADATGSPEEALGWVERGERYDVALVDLRMPRMDGLSLAAELRRLCSGTDLSIVIVSSTRLGATPPGVVDAALLKPIRPSRLLECLRRLWRAEPASSPAPLSIDPGRKLASAHPLRILVAEDHPVNQRVIGLLFKSLGYQPDFAADGAEALIAVERQPYDVVFMDVRMPVMDGLEAARRLCARWPREARPRIVGLSANAMTEDRRLGAQAGMEDYLFKPVTSEALRAALERCGRVHRDAAAASRPEATPASPPRSASRLPLPPRSPLFTFEAPIDEGVFESVVSLAALEGGEDTLVTLVSGFLSSSERLIAELVSAVELGDAPALELAAHSLKSSAAMFGALHLSRLCADLEALAESSAALSLVARAAEIAALLRALDQVRRAFRARFPSIP